MIRKEEREIGLDYDYNVFVFNQINGANTLEKRKWIIYDSILDELFKMGELKLIKEIKYKITDHQNDKKVFKNSLIKIKNKSAMLNLLINSI